MCHLCYIVLRCSFLFRYCTYIVSHDPMAHIYRVVSSDICAMSLDYVFRCCTYIVSHDLMAHIHRFVSSDICVASLDYRPDVARISCHMIQWHIYIVLYHPIYVLYRWTMYSDVAPISCYTEFRVWCHGHLYYLIDFIAPRLIESRHFTFCWIKFMNSALRSVENWSG